MESNSSRRSACDRCRGQKLRCVGLGNPIFDSQSRHIRNEIPCDRCRKVQVECYSVNLTPRKRGPDLVSTSHGHRLNPSTSSYPHLDSSSSESSEPRRSDWARCSPQEAIESHANLQSPAWSALTSGDQAWGDGINVNVDSPHGMSGADLSMLYDLCSDKMMETGIEPSPQRNNSIDCAIEDILQDESNLPYHGSGSGSACSSISGSDPDSVSKCLRELAELTKTLLYNKINQHGAGSSTPNYPCPRSHPAGATITTASGSPHSVGRTLRHGLQFLNVLQSLQRRRRSDLSLGDPTRLSSSISDAGITSPSPTLAYPPSRPSSSFIDTPTLFWVLSCYANILEEYERLFDPILESVTHSTPRIPPTLMGTSLDGFNLDGNKGLQMELLLYVSSNLLEKIETALVGSTDGNTGEVTGGLLLGYNMSGCLDALYHQNGSETKEGGVKGESRAKSLIRNIQIALRTLQL